MGKTRLEAFTDAVIAIIMTILALELKRPDGATFADLWALRHSFLVYFISFATLAIYWNNHHHLFQAAKVVSGRILWWNIILLFCISLFPFTTVWVGEYLTSRAAEITYGVLMLAADVVWVFLAYSLLREHSKESTLYRSLVGSKKPAFTIGVIVIGLIIGWFWPPAVILFCLISLIPWVVPDRRIEKHMQDKKE
ncbi:MAG: TMEM175 family protein [Desulfuromonadales bacterium]|nr:TMEM175 family protein [Desulfuromonadales bacterium]